MTAQDAQGLINAKRAGLDVADQKIVDAFRAELLTIKDGHPDLFAALIAEMDQMVKDHTT